MGSADISQFVVTTADGTACEISTLKVRALFPHLPATFTGTSSNFWASSLLADLPVFPSLVCGSCSSGQGFPTASFRFHLTMDTLAVQLCTSSLPTRTRDLHPLERAHGAQTKKSCSPHLFFRCEPQLFQQSWLDKILSVQALSARILFMHSSERLLSSEALLRSNPLSSWKEDR